MWHTGRVNAKQSGRRLSGCMRDLIAFGVNRHMTHKTFRRVVFLHRPRHPRPLALTGKKAQQRWDDAIRTLGPLVFNHTDFQRRIACVPASRVPSKTVAETRLLVVLEVTNGWCSVKFKLNVFLGNRPVVAVGQWARRVVKGQARHGNARCASSSSRVCAPNA